MLAAAEQVPAAAATISGAFAAFAADLRFEDLPPEVVSKARAVLLDTLGCILAGSVTEELASAAAASRAACGEGGTAQVLGTAMRLPLPFAALCNATAAHAREMDDFEGCLHSGAVIIPAVLGAAIAQGASGRELLTAIVIGYDVARRVLEGCGGNLPLKRRGWHSTSATGGYGAAAAVGRLLGLDTETLQSAIGLAATTAAGTWAFIGNGADSKRVHPGLAAQGGITAAYLAQGGITGPDAIFEAEWGGVFAMLAGEDATPARAAAGLGQEFRISIVGVKPYAACRGNHSGIDVALQLRAEGIRADEVERITIRGNHLHLVQLGRRDVQSTIEAQFSLPYSVAVALAEGRATLDQYQPGALARPHIRGLVERIEMVLDEAVGEGEQPFIDVTLRDGRMLTRRVLIARGDRRNPLSEDELRAKFRANAAEALTETETGELERLLDGVAELGDVGAIGRLLEKQSMRADAASQGRSH